MGIWDTQQIRQDMIRCNITDVERVDYCCQCFHLVFGITLVRKMIMRI